MRLNETYLRMRYMYEMQNKIQKDIVIISSVAYTNASNAQIINNALHLVSTAS